MLYLVLEFLKKNVIYLLIIGIFAGLFTWKTVENYNLQNTINVLQSEKIQLEQSREIAKQKAQNSIDAITYKYQLETKEREKRYDKQYKDLLTRVSTTKSDLNGLHNVTEEIRSSVHDTNTPRETIVRYIDNYKTVFDQCIVEYAEVAKDAEQQVIIINTLNDEIESIYQLFDRYKEENLKISE